jgi:4-amino-4-deoxy-L-arabinose transferase
MAARSERWLRWAPLVLAITYLAPLGVRPLGAPDEVRYAEISREMITTGDWVVPHFLGLRYFEKPVLGYWINSLSQLLFGHSNFAARFPSALSALLGALLVGCFAARSSGRSVAGFPAATIYLSSLMVFVVGTTSVLDSLLAMWTTAAMLAFYWAYDARSVSERPGRYALFGVCCGLGFLTKGGVALAVPFISIVPFMVWQGRFRELALWGWVAAGAAALTVLPWAWAVAVREPDFWHYFLFEEHLRRFAGEDAQHAQPFWYFLPVMLIGGMPWIFALPAALRGLISSEPERARGEPSPLFRFLLLWLLLPLLFFSVSRGKLATYVLPCFAPLALLLALGLSARWRSAQASRPLRAVASANVVFGGVLLAAVVVAVAATADNGHVFSARETYEPVCLLLALLVWSGTAWLWRRRAGAGALLAFALLPVPFMLAAPFVHPASGALGRMPGPFITHQVPALAADTVVVSNSVALAGALGWYYSRSDIDLLDTSGELSYGLAYPGAGARHITHGDFAQWLHEERPRHDVAVFADSDIGANLPAADAVFRGGVYFLYLYRSGF